MHLVIRSPMRRLARMGSRARRRILAGGPTSVHRPALSVEGYRTFSRMKFTSQAWRCGWCIAVKPLDLDHAANRSQGGADTWANTLGLCSGPGGCHQAKSRPYAIGRLLTIPLGDGLIDLLWVVGPNKHDYTIVTRKVVGRAPTSLEREILEALV